MSVLGALIVYARSNDSSGIPASLRTSPTQKRPLHVARACLIETCEPSTEVVVTSRMTEIMQTSEVWKVGDWKEHLHLYKGKKGTFEQITRYNGEKLLSIKFDTSLPDNKDLPSETIYILAGCAKPVSAPHNNRDGDAHSPACRMPMCVYVPMCCL